MKLNIYILWFASLVLVASISACGMQGDLYLPQKKTEPPVDMPETE